MMDQTHLFQATVRTIRLKMKNQRREESGGLGSGSDTSSTLLRKGRRKTEFAKEAIEVAACVTKLRDFLMRHRKDYINSAGYLVSTPSAMTDQERDEIDSAAQEFIHSCSDKIENLHQKVVDTRVGQQVQVHRQAVYESLREYLKGVCQLYSEQRAMRVKRIVDRKRIFRLQPEDHKKLLSLKETPSLKSNNKDSDKERSPSSTPSAHMEDRMDDDRENEEEQSEREASPTTTATSASVPRPDRVDAIVRGSDRTSSFGVLVDSGDSDGAVDDGLTEEERETFERENEQLFSEMNSMVDEVRQIEGKVLEISRLQEIFTENVLTQATELDIIHGQAVEASENVKEGNEQVRGAIKNKASFRLWILFVLIVFSFSLLFLDWYN